MNEPVNSAITSELLEKAFTYQSFSELVERLHNEHKLTGGEVTPAMLNYTKLNIQRTHRIDKRGKLLDETLKLLSDIKRSQIWLVITEGWCGDSAQILPYIAKMADASEQVSLRIILRDEHPEVMDQYLTNGISRSIPKIVLLDEHTLEPLANWGPRPEAAHSIFMKERDQVEIGPQKAAENLHIWYARNKGSLIQQEFGEVLKTTL
jgi:hypothetical protein